MSIGIDRLLFALNQINQIDFKNNEPVLICILDSKYLDNVIQFRLFKRK